MTDNSNFLYNGNGTNPYFANYMQNNPQFSSMYPYDQPNSIFQSASALAAVAAAAVGYGQQQNYSSTINDSMNAKNSPLNLAHGSGSDSFSQFKSNESTDAGTAGRGLPGGGVSYQNYYDAWQQYYAFSNSSSALPPTTLPLASIPPATSTSFMPPTAANGSKKLKNSSCSNKMKIKPEKKQKLMETGSSQKKKEFDLLVKARTEKLMSDGPVVYSPNNQNETKVSLNKSIDAVPKESGNQLNAYAKLVQLVLDSKKRSLLKSTAIQRYFAKQQHHLEAYKRSTELFSVTLNMPSKTGADFSRK